MRRAVAKTEISVLRWWRGRDRRRHTDNVPSPEISERSSGEHYLRRITINVRVKSILAYAPNILPTLEDAGFQNIT